MAARSDMAGAFATPGQVVVDVADRNRTFTDGRCDPLGGVGSDVADGKDTSICEVCRVYKTYGEGKPIQLKLMGRGINTSLQMLEKTTVA